MLYAFGQAIRNHIDQDEFWLLWVGRNYRSRANGCRTDIRFYYLSKTRANFVELFPNGAVLFAWNIGTGWKYRQSRRHHLPRLPPITVKSCCRKDPVSGVEGLLYLPFLRLWYRYWDSPAGIEFQRVMRHFQRDMKPMVVYRSHSQTGLFWAWGERRNVSQILRFHGEGGTLACYSRRVRSV